jgi:hypothetical protein
MNGIPAIQLGRKQMKFGPATLLCTALLIAALPIRADSLSDTRTADAFHDSENSAPEFRLSTTKTLSPATSRVISESSNSALFTTTFPASDARLDSSQLDERRSDRTPAIVSIGGFEPISSFAAWSSEASLMSATMFPSSPDFSSHSGMPNERGSGDLALSVFASEGAWRRIRRERGRGHDGKDNDGKDPGPSGSTTVPEPEALPLLLFGLAAVGILARRRNAFAAAA